MAIPPIYNNPFPIKEKSVSEIFFTFFQTRFPDRPDELYSFFYALTVDKIIFLYRIVDLLSHILDSFFLCHASVQHILDLSLNNLTSFREYT